MNYVILVLENFHNYYGEVEDTIKSYGLTSQIVWANVLPIEIQVTADVVIILKAANRDYAALRQGAQAICHLSRHEGGHNEHSVMSISKSSRLPFVPFNTIMVQGSFNTLLFYGLAVFVANLERANAETP
jgi:hypothetical protein